MRRTKVLLGLLATLATATVPVRTYAQCRQQTIGGGTSTLSYQSGFAVAGSPLGNLNALDGNFYESTNLTETAAVPSVRTLYSTWCETGQDAGIPEVGPLYHGGVFLNPTNNPITVTQVDVIASPNPASRSVFASIISSSAPGVGAWAVQSGTNLRWRNGTTGIVVPPHAAQEFLVLIRPPKGSFTNQTTANLTMTVTTSVGGPYSFATTGRPHVLVNVTTWAATAMVGFDLTGTATLDARSYWPAVPAGTASTFSVRVRQTDDNNTYSQDDVRDGLQLTILIPNTWSRPTTTVNATLWNTPTVTASGSNWQIQATTRTGQFIVRNTSTPASSFLFTSTPPSGTSATLTGLYPFSMSLNGFTRDTASAGSVLSVNQGVVQVINPVNVEFLSPSLTAGSIRQIDLSTSVNIFNGLGTNAESVRLDVYNFSSATWENGTPVNPGPVNALLTRAFGASYPDYLNGTGQMRLRYVTSSSAWQRLRIDQLQWVKALGFTVSNSRGADTNPGDVARPFATIARGLTALGAQGGVFVEVGNSRAGTPYAANNLVTGAARSGIATCKTLVQGIPSSGQPPLIRGANPASDFGFEVGGAPGNLANHVQVDGFEIQNSQIGLASDPGVTATVFSNNVIATPAGGYGVILDTNISAEVLNNRTDGENNGTFWGITDWSGTNTLIDGNRCRRHKRAEAIYSYGSSGLVIRRNIAAENYIGVSVVNPAGGFTLYNNTLDSNDYLGVYAENPTAAVTSRNNIITNNGIGWATDSQASADRVSSNYDDVFNNQSNYVFHGTVAAGANSISAAPGFVQTTDPALSTYYHLAPGSPCLNAGVAVGLPFCGPAPDLGAVEACP